MSICYFINFPFWFWGWHLGSDCPSSCTLLVASCYAYFILVYYFWIHDDMYDWLVAVSGLFGLGFVKKNDRIEKHTYIQTDRRQTDRQTYKQYEENKTGTYYEEIKINYKLDPYTGAWTLHVRKERSELSTLGARRWGYFRP